MTPGKIAVGRRSGTNTTAPPTIGRWERISKYRPAEPGKYAGLLLVTTTRHLLGLVHLDFSIYLEQFVRFCVFPRGRFFPSERYSNESHDRKLRSSHCF